jgi:hypothetical protein
VFAVKNAHASSVFDDTMQEQFIVAILTTQTGKVGKMTIDRPLATRAANVHAHTTPEYFFHTTPE